MAASDALRLNWDSRNFGPKVDMPAIRVASVAPAKHRKRKVGFFNRSSTDLQKKIPKRQSVKSVFVHNQQIIKAAWNNLASEETLFKHYRYSQH